MKERFNHVGYVTTKRNIHVCGYNFEREYVRVLFQDTDLEGKAYKRIRKRKLFEDSNGSYFNYEDEKNYLKY